MTKFLSASLLAIVIGATSAMAQTSPSTSEPGSATPEATVPAEPQVITLSDAETQAWMKKPVYSLDGINIGEVTEIQRNAAGRVTGLRVGSGGFLGIGETHLKFAVAEFKLGADRVALTLSAAQVKALPNTTQ